MVTRLHGRIKEEESYSTPCEAEVLIEEKIR
jgi:hypothetical protein